MIYAVNKRTKAHEVMDPNALYNTAVWEEVHADPDGWIEWQSSEYEGPMPGGSRCEIRLSNGDGFIISDPEDWDWSKGGDQWIIAYRPMLATKASHPGTMAGPDKCRSDGGEWPAWDGEGLPPVGARGVDGDGDIVEVVAHHHGHAVCYLVDYADHQYIDVEYSQFRPIRSEEGRITEELERIMYKPAMTREMAARIYEAIRDGKVPGVKLTGGEV